MKDRMTMGFSADAAETAALTIPDERATERIVEALDWEQDERMAEIAVRRRRERDRKRRNRAVVKVKKMLGADCANVLKAWLDRRTWRDIGIPERTFWDRLKKVKNFFGLENTR